MSAASMNLKTVAAYLMLYLIRLPRQNSGAKRLYVSLKYPKQVHGICSEISL